jgi:hypothetical protein
VDGPGRPATADPHGGGSGAAVVTLTGPPFVAAVLALQPL